MDQSTSHKNPADKEITMRKKNDPMKEDRLYEQFKRFSNQQA